MKFLFVAARGGLSVCQSSWGPSSSSRGVVAQRLASIARGRVSGEIPDTSPGARRRPPGGVEAMASLPPLTAHRSVFPQTAQRPSCPASLPTLPN